MVTRIWLGALPTAHTPADVHVQGVVSCGQTFACSTAQFGAKALLIQTVEMQHDALAQSLELLHTRA